MRRLILTAAAALTLAACGKNNQTDNANIVSDNLTSESIVSNDVTAIDAVTGDAANMAADVDMNYGDLGNTIENEASPPATRATPAPRKRAGESAAETPTPAQAPTNNTTE